MCRCPARELANAIRLPSGDHAGSTSNASPFGVAAGPKGPFVSRCWSLPSALDAYKSYTLSRVDTKTSASAPLVEAEPPQPASVAARQAAGRTKPLVRKRLDAEVAALHLRVARELPGRGLGRDLAADHDQLPLGQRGRDAEVLLDQQDAQAFAFQALEDLDQVLDD